jgi:hypothetical protein
MNGHMQNNPLFIVEIIINMFYKIEKQYVIECIDKKYVTIFIIQAQCGNIKIKIDNFT